MGAGESKTTSVTDKSGNTTIEFEWPLENASKLPTCDVGYLIDHAIASTGSATKYSFSLCLYPHGYNERTKKHVSLWLKKLTTDELSLRFTCRIVDGDGKTLIAKKKTQNLALESFLGWPIFCSRRVLVIDADSTLRDTKLGIKGKIEVFGSISDQSDGDSACQKSFSEMSENFQHLLEGQSLSDFVIVVGGRRLRTHRAVLSARSKVFRTMFESALYQKTSSYITITDISSEGLEVLLKYIYTGRLDHLSVPVCMEVYYAADKYEVFTLRDTCSKILSGNLLPDNVIDILLLAFRHSDLELHETCLSFMDKNLREIKGKPEWIDLMRNYPDLADKALFFSSDLK